VTTQAAYHAHDNRHDRDLDADAVEITRADSAAPESPIGFIARLPPQFKKQLGSLSRFSQRPFGFGAVAPLQVDAGFLDRIRSGGLCLETPKDETPEYKRWRELLRARIRKAVDSVRRRHSGRRALDTRSKTRPASVRHFRSSRRTTRVARSVAKKVTADPDEPRHAPPPRDVRFDALAPAAVISLFISIGGEV
jgi:hypothetical protein